MCFDSDLTPTKPYNLNKFIETLFKFDGNFQNSIKTIWATFRSHFKTDRTKNNTYPDPDLYKNNYGAIYRRVIKLYKTLLKFLSKSVKNFMSNGKPKDTTLLTSLSNFFQSREHNHMNCFPNRHYIF